MGGGGGGGFNPIGDIAKGVGNAVGGDIGKGIKDVGNVTGRYFMNPLGPVGGVANLIDDISGQPKAPEAPSISNSLSDLQIKQRQKAQDFRNNLSGMKQQTATNLRADANEQLKAQQGMIDQSNASRGLLYGGINSKQKAGAAGATQEGLLKATNQANIGFDQAADNLESQALDTAYGIQQSQQNIQQQVYSQAMAQMNGKNQVASGALGLLGTFGLKAAGI